MLRFQRHDGDVLSACSGRGPGDVEGLGHRCPFITFVVLCIALCNLVVGGRPECSTGGIHRNVAAADDHNLVANVGGESLVGVDEKLDGFEDSVGLVTL